MKKRLGFIFFMAVLTASGIIIFQLYWVYNSYKTGERTFNRSVSIALQKSIDNYQLQQSELPSSLKAKLPSLSVFMSSSPSIPSAVMAGKGTKQKAGVDIKFQTVNIAKSNLVMVQLMMTRLMSQSMNKPVNLDTLGKLFKAELLKSNVNIPYKLSLLKDQKNFPANKIIGYVSFAKDATVVEAVSTATNQYLLSQNITPALISLMLILLTAGSLFYMWLIIRRQIQLDDIKNDFINNITHELRTPISVLKSTHEALFKFDEVTNREKTLRYLEINSVILNKLDQNVDRILDITQYESGTKLVKLEPVKLNLLIADTMQRFSLNEDAIINYKYELKTNEVVTDSYIIDTVVSNLIDNALKYADKAAIVHVNVTALDKGWQLQVQDNGKGINDKYLPFIFDKFYRVPAGNLHDVKGYGLGLSYVKELVELLKGAITVKSKMGAGTIFTIQFPEV